MPFPTLSQFLAYPPGFTLATPIEQVISELIRKGGTFCSHIIILDAYRRPTGALSVNYLWRTFSPTAGQSTLHQLEAWVEPVVQVSANQTLGTVWPLPPADAAPPMVVVDDAMGYVGVVNPLAVLTWLSGEIQSPTGLTSEEDSRIRVGGPNSNPKNWLLEVSHALKNPMTSLLGLSTLLLDQRIGTLNQRQTRYATLIQQVVRKLITLVNQLLDWMRLEADQLSFEVESVELEPFIRRVLHSYWDQLAANPPPWAESFALDLPQQPLTVEVDPLRLQLSLHWILDYFLLHQTEPAGIETSRWGPWVGLTLWTLGPPIAALEALETGQLPAALQPGEEQAGTVENLGLLLTQKFCQGQGGDLTYRTSQGGNRINLLLPQAAQQRSENPEPNPAATSVLVLLICRHQEIMDQVCLHLQGSDYRLAIARSLVAAEGMIQRLRPTFAVVCPRSFPDGLPALAGEQSRLGQITSVLRLLTVQGGPQTEAEETVPGVTLATLKPTLDQLTETAAGTPSQPAPSGFTILLLPLPTVQTTTVASSRLPSELRSWLQHYHCRLLQVDDLAQAQVLSRVWQPDGVLMDTGASVEPDSWQAIAQFSELIRLPFITLNPDNCSAEAATLGLTVLHCPALECQPQQGASKLIQTLENAVKGPPRRDH